MFLDRVEKKFRWYDIVFLFQCEERRQVASSLGGDIEEIIFNSPRDSRVYVNIYVYTVGRYVHTDGFRLLVPRDSFCFEYLTKNRARER